MHSLCRQLRARDFDEQQAVIAQRITNHALLVTRFIGVVGQVLVPEHHLPPLRQSVRVVGVDRRVRNERRHDTPASRGMPAGHNQSVGKDTFDCVTECVWNCRRSARRQDYRPSSSHADLANDRSTVVWLDRAVRSTVDGSW